MNRFVIYGFVAGIAAGVFIGKFSGSIFKIEPTESPSSSSESRVESHELPAQLTTHNSQRPTPDPLLSTPDSQPTTPDWSNALIILEDAYKKKDWKSFLKTLEVIQSDEKYPLSGIIGLLKNGFTQSAITSIQDTDTKNALFIAENILKGNGNRKQKIDILRTIGHKGKDVTPLLKWVVENEKDVQLSSLALNAIGEIKDPALIPFLSDYAKNRHELPLRLAAIEALENLDSDAIEPLEALLNAHKLGDGNDELVLKSAVIETLGNIGNSEAVFLLSNLARNQKESKNHDSYILQQDAIEALGDIGSPEALLSIGEIIANEGINTQLRGFALETLVKAKKDESAQILEDIVNDKTVQKLDIKKDAISALGDIKEPETISFLTELITRPNNETPVSLQLEALSAIGRIGDPETVPMLETIINNEYVDTEVRQDAIFTLGKVGTETAVSVLERIVNDSANPVFSRAALRGLQKIGSNDSISIIESVAREHPSEDIRLIASKLLGISKHSQ